MPARLPPGGHGLGRACGGAPGKKAHWVLIDESGIFLSPRVRRSFSPRGQTPVLKTPGRKRQKVSLIAALSIAPRNQRVSLLFPTVADRHITQVETAAFLRQRLRHRLGPVLLIWDRGSTHKGAALRQVLADYPRLEMPWLPAYAPELNPNEYVWNYLQYGALANYLPNDTQELEDRTMETHCDTRADPYRRHSFFAAAPLTIKSPTMAA